MAGKGFGDSILDAAKGAVSSSGKTAGGGRKKRAPAKKKPGGIGGAIGAVARGEPVRRAAPSRRTSEQPTTSPTTNVLSGASAVGDVLSGKRSSSPAAAKERIDRGVAREQRRRSKAVQDYTSKPRAERSKIAAAAENRVAAGRGSSDDKLIVQTHARRTRNDAGRSGSAVAAANAAHDKLARQQQLTKLMDGIGKSASGSAKVKHEGTLLSDSFGPLIGVTKGAAKGVGAGAVGVAKGIDAARKFDPLGVQDHSSKGDALRGGVDPGGAAKALALPVRTAGNVAQVAADDPSQIPRAVKDIASMVKDLPAGVISTIRDPEGAGAATIKDLKRRYGPLVEGNDKEFRERLKKEGIAPEVVDVLGLASGESTVAAKGVSGVAKATAKVTAPGTRVNRAANRTVRAINDPRPDLVIGDGKAVAQRKSSGIVGIAVQRRVDQARRNRVARQVEAKGDKARLGEVSSSVARKGQQKANQRGRTNYGRGVRGVLPQDGQVAHLSAGRRGPFDRQAAAQRKHLSKITGTASRRVNRSADDFARPAEAALTKLRPEERRAARAALEGRLTLDDPSVALRQVDQMIGDIKAERKKLQEKPKKAAEYSGLIGDQTDNLKSLTQLRQDLVERPDKVLTKQLRAFVKAEQTSRPDFESMAADVLSPTTMKRRRVDPAAKQFGTYEQHAIERRALDRLREAGGDAVKASERITKQREKASATSKVGKDKRRKLGQEQRALEQITAWTDGKLDADAIDAIEADLVDAHVKRTTAAAEAAGVKDFDPAFFAHRRTDDGGLGEFTAGAGAKGKVSGFKRSEMRLHTLGFVDETPGGYAIGKQQAGKRAAQWQMVDEIAQDFVPRWAKGKDGKGITRKEFDSYVRKHGLDPQDWALWQSKASVGPENRGSVADQDMGLTLADVERLGANAPEWTRGRFHVVPRNVLGDMSQQSGRAARTAQRIAGGTSGLILGSNPFYAVRQAIQTTPLTIIHTFPRIDGSAAGGIRANFGFLDPLVIKNFRALRKAEKNNPRVMRDLHDRFGTRSRMRDFTEAPRMGALARDQKRWAAGINYDQRILFGVDWTRLLEERRSVGSKGTASMLARTVGKRNPVSLVMRASRDFNQVVDAWQDRLQRSFVLAFEDAKMSREGIRDNFPELAAQGAGDVARKLGPIAAASQLPWSEYKALDRSPEFRHMAEDAGDALVRWMGDYANYSKFEQRYARSFFMFYGFVRHSSRLLLTTLPLDHPLMFAAVMQQGRIANEERQDLIDEFAKRHLLTPEMARGILAISDGDKLKTIDTKWMNPLLGPLMDIGSNGISGQLPIPTPYVAALEARFGTSNFTGSPLTNEKGAAVYDNKLTGIDRGRVFANRMMSMIYPVRVLDTALNGDMGKMADTSIPLLDPKAIKNKPGGIADDRNQARIKEAKEAGGLLRALQSGVPLFPKSGSGLLNSAIYETDKDKPKAKKKRKPAASGGSFGGGSFVGGSSWGGWSFGGN